MVGLQTTSIRTQLGPKLNGLVNYKFLAAHAGYDEPGSCCVSGPLSGAGGEGAGDLLGYYLPPFGYAYLQVVGDAVKGAGTPDQGKLAEYIDGHPLHTLPSDIRFGADGDWTEARVMFERSHDVKGSDVDQFRDGKAETILHPPSVRSGSLIEPYSDAIH